MAGFATAPPSTRLWLLGSPPDQVRGLGLHGTRPEIIQLMVIHHIIPIRRQYSSCRSDLPLKHFGLTNFVRKAILFRTGLRVAEGM